MQTQDSVSGSGLVVKVVQVVVVGIATTPREKELVSVVMVRRAKVNQSVYQKRKQQNFVPRVVESNRKRCSSQESKRSTSR